MKRTPYTMLITLLRWSLLATLLLGFAAQAEPVARVLMANGDVRAIQSDQSVRALNRGDMLYAGDTIRTGKTSSAQFRFTDGALIALRAESEFNIEQHHYNEQTPQQNEQSGQLVRGGLRAITGAIGRERPEAVNMRTPVATIGIRGTVYETIYIPPGGHPALPGVESGHYTVVLRGRVAISNAGGELVIGDGEIAFVRDANTPPVLRPDLSALFARFAALENVEEIIAELQEDAVKLQDILNVLTETALPEPGPTAGPFGFIAVQEWPDGPGTSYSGSFFNQAVEMDGELLISAENGTGDIQTFSGELVEVQTSSSIIADSTVYWGTYYGGFEALDASGDLLNVESYWEAYYVTATNVLRTTNDLPTTGNITYQYAGGSGTELIGGQLNVDFLTALMSVDITVWNEVTWSATGANISNFYGAGVDLISDPGATPGTINGRFVGSNAEGAITYFDLNNGEFIGTAVFDSGSASITPQ